ncbi:MAG: endonuclease/exonuclease/phosphatase family protein [Ruminococcus sp.]|nr:endonuclease/exonuclease/phosphatase family protein [Ruminococcus sp.]
MKNNKFLRILLRTVISVLLVILIVALSYIAYLFIDYERIEDNISLEVVDKTGSLVPVNKDLKALSYNIGFCAYTQDFSFFMDGGESSWAKSEESVGEVLADIGEFVNSQDADITLMQEVDENSTRSYHVNQKQYLIDSVATCDAVSATNFDSSFLFYPFLEPHGKSLSGILTFSKYNIESATRRSLPVEDSIMKFFDLDRCYAVSRLKCENDKELVLYNAHLSAYTSDGTIATEQLKLLLNDMKAEYDKGNYVICGGDFNKDLLQNSGKIFGVSGEDYTWAQAFPLDMLNNTGFSLIAPFDKNNPVASCRNTDEPYKEEGQFNVTLDGFIVSDNVTVSKSDVIDLEFKYSDHNPVFMNFRLEG